MQLTVFPTIERVLLLSTPKPDLSQTIIRINLVVIVQKLHSSSVFFCFMEKDLIILFRIIVTSITTGGDSCLSRQRPSQGNL
jgi:hypothetical protein